MTVFLLNSYVRFLPVLAPYEREVAEAARRESSDSCRADALLLRTTLAKALRVDRF